MRSWFVGMPGENLSCVGCHEKQNTTVPNTRNLAATRAPSEITPWYGPARPFSYRYEVQPVLDRNCVSCHKATNALDLVGLKTEGGYTNEEYRQNKSYMNLQLYVRRPGPESDQHMFRPMEYHASTSDLVQLLEKGHYGVKLGREDWERIAAWIDLNAPYRGSWKPGQWRGCPQDQIRREYAQRFANVDTNPEGEYAALAKKVMTLPQTMPVMVTKPTPALTPAPEPKVQGWPFDNAKATQMQTAYGAAEQTITVTGAGGSVPMKLKRIPEGRFVMGSNHGYPDEAPANVVVIPRPFWMGELEVSNKIYHLFDPSHDSGYHDLPGKDHTTPGMQADGPDQPVIRVTWQEAMNFCQWLSGTTGRKFTLPTEAQWEWSCRAGTSTDLWYGSVADNFGRYANLAGSEARVELPYPKIDNVSDRQAYPQRLGAYQANAWGLKDMHGGVAEWTRTSYRPYPYAEGDGRNDLSLQAPKVVRGGSWRSRPAWARSAFRSSFQSWQPVSTVGFRVVCEDAVNTPQISHRDLVSGSGAGGLKTVGMNGVAVSGQVVNAPRSGHRCLVSGCGAGAVTMVGKNGAIEWEYPIASECSDCWKLPNGNLFFSYKEGVREVKPDKTTVWEFPAPAGCEIQGCQPLGDNRYLVAESHKDGMTLLYEMDSGRKIVKTVTLNLGGGSHQQVRQIRKTPQGTYLACQQRGGGKAMEFDGGGKLLHTFPSGRFVAERLPDGNTLIDAGMNIA